MLICLNDKNNYVAFFNGKNIPLKKVFDGLYYVKIKLKDTRSSTRILKVTKSL
jgi:hypothetical protein